MAFHNKFKLPIYTAYEVSRCLTHVRIVHNHEQTEVSLVTFYDWDGSLDVKKIKRYAWERLI